MNGSDRKRMAVAIFGLCAAVLFAAAARAIPVDASLILQRWVAHHGGAVPFVPYDGAASPNGAAVYVTGVGGTVALNAASGTE